MKTYEQMTKDVLVRRDKELKDKAVRRRRLLTIGVPCAVALMLASVCAIDFAASHRIYRHNLIAGPENSGGVYNSSLASGAANEVESGPGIITSSAAPSTVNSTGNELSWLDYAEPIVTNPIFTNPKSGQNDIHVIEVEAFNSENDTVVKDPLDLRLYTMKELYSYYGIEFDRLTKLHSSWGLEHEPLGIYTRHLSDGDLVALQMYCTRNTLNYTTEKGAKVSVSAQLGKFDPLSKEMFAWDKPFTPTYPKPYSDPAGSYAGIGAYNPETDPNRPTNDEGVSLLNGYDAYIYRDSNDNFAADIDMGTRVRITAVGLSEEEFLTILDEYTA